MKLYHGGSYQEGGLNRVIYLSDNPEMAASYVDMARDRGHENPRVQAFEVTLRRPAPQEIALKFAQQAGTYDQFYTPASCFDSELHGEEEVRQLVQLLRRAGYDGAGPLEDIAYGQQIEGSAYVVFDAQQMHPLHESVSRFSRLLDA